MVDVLPVKAEVDETLPSACQYVCFSANERYSEDSSQQTAFRHFANNYGHPEQEICKQGSSVVNGLACVKGPELKKKKTNTCSYNKEQLERIDTLSLDYHTDNFFPRTVDDWHKLSLETAQSASLVVFILKVVHNVGLCIALWDIENYENSFIYPGDGATHTVVLFRYVVFHPFIDEILVGKVKSCSKEGINVSMDFFDDIFIPEDNLPHPSKFETEQMWFWKYEEHDLYFEIGHEIRFRVMEERFVDTSPTGPEGMVKETADSEPGPKKSPYTIVGTLAEQGLGLLSWWATGDESAG